MNKKHTLFLSFTNFLRLFINHHIKLESTNLFYFGCMRAHVFGEMSPPDGKGNCTGVANEIYWFLPEMLPDNIKFARAQEIHQQVMDIVSAAEKDQRVAWRRRLDETMSVAALMELLTRHGYPVTLAETERLKFSGGDFGLNYPHTAEVLRVLHPSIACQY